MNQIAKKVLAWASTSMLLTAALVGVVSSPAQAADAPAPQMLIDFESEAIVQAPWNALPGMQFSGDGDNGWVNYVANADKPNGSVGSTKMLKAVMGSGAYSGVFIKKTTTDSMLSAANHVVTMNFWAPAAGKIVALHMESGDYPPASALSVNASSTTVSGWQTLTFDFGPANPNYTLPYNRLWIDYDPASTTVSPDFFLDDVAVNGAVSRPLTGGTVDYDVRLISSQKDTSTDSYEWTSCGGASWCLGNNYFMKFISAGASTTLTYVVTQHGTSNTVSGASVSLRMNTAYSGSNATWSSGGTSFGAVSSSTGSDAGAITGTTNGSGQVSFTFTNTNTSGEAVRTLNNANPYPSGCNSPAGQTKGALQPTVTAITGVNIGTQYVDVLWPHVTSSTIDSSIAAGSDGSNCGASTPSSGSTMWVDPDNKGKYAHIRLDKSFLDTKFDASWWDGVWQYRDADSKAYLKYIPVGSTFKLTYVVTGPDNMPLADTPVTLIVNANYSCAKTFFLYQNSLIGPDDCSGGGQTELPAKKTDGQGRVSFILTNTNTVGESMPADLNGLPNGKEIGTNIKPHLVGATQEGIDMLFAHFVQPAEKATVTAPAESSVAAGGNQWSTFTFLDETGKAIAGSDVSFVINGFDARTGWATTDKNGNVVIRSSNSTSAIGKQVVAVSLIRPGKLPLTGSAVVNWISPSVSMTASGAKGAVVVTVSSANGKSVKINVGGKIYARTATSDSASFTIPATAGAKKVVVTVGTKSVTKTVTVSK